VGGVGILEAGQFLSSTQAVRQTCTTEERAPGNSVGASKLARRIAALMFDWTTKTIRLTWAISSDWDRSFFRLIGALACCRIAANLALEILFEEGKHVRLPKRNIREDKIVSVTRGISDWWVDL
jgi:hypothetical protein